MEEPTKNEEEVEFRHYGELDCPLEAIPVSSFASSSAEDKVAAIRRDIIGSQTMFSTPFGQKPIIYADWTASGRCLGRIEEILQTQVLPFYGNTHTTTSITGHQSTCFRAEARQIVAECCNAKITGKAAEDTVLFTGQGTTSAVNKLIDLLGLKCPFTSGLHEAFVPVVFVSSYEHHSNLLPWRESVAIVVTIPYHPTTGVDLEALAQALTAHSAHRVLIGAFSAASNITGVLTDCDAICCLMHAHGGLAVFDYATAAPYITIDMNPPSFAGAGAGAGGAGAIAKDAVFFSGHKFLGGPGASGCLIVKRALLPCKNEPPSSVGGGSVFFVTSSHHRYLSNREEREEAGTPALLADVKLALAMNLKRDLGVRWIESREQELVQMALSQFADEERIVVLGPPHTTQTHRLPILSFLIKYGAKFLHFHFVAVLLNDLFGIQARGGCMCAGPYTEGLLGFDATAIEGALLDKHEVLRPGVTRLSLAYWCSVEEVQYVLSAVRWVAEHGWKYLPYYRYNYKTGEWAHTTRLTRFPERIWLSSQALYPPSAAPTAVTASMPENVLMRTMQEVRDGLAQMEGSREHKLSITGAGTAGAGSKLEGYEALRWFATMDDVRHGGGAGEGTCAINPSHPTLPSIPSTSQAISSSARTPYAVAINRAIAPRMGADDGLIPRYLTMALRASEEVPFLQVLRENAHAYIKGDKGGMGGGGGGAGGRGSAEDKECSTGTCTMRPPVAPSTSSTMPSAPSAMPTAPKFLTPPKKLMKLVGQAVKDWNMIVEGDKLLLGLSGGKDSMALLHILVALQKRAPIKFTIAVATVDPQTASFDPSPLIPYVESLGLTYHYLSEPIVKLAEQKLQGDSLCAFCSRLKRGLLYSCCRTNGYTKLVLAQHLDDLVESFLMSALHNGQIRTMKANYLIEAGDVSVIRPLVYVREGMARDFSQSSRLPIINENCPACFEQPKERARMKQLMEHEEAMVPGLFHNLRKALIPLMHDDFYATTARIQDLIEKQGMKPGSRVSTKRAKGKKGAQEEAEDAEAEEEAEEVEGAPAKRAKVEEVKEQTSEQILQDVLSGKNQCEGGYCAPCYELA